MPATTVISRCSRCGNLGYFTGGRLDIAQATACECIENCTRCDGVGYTYEVRQKGYTYAVPCKCQLVRQRIDFFNQAGIPARYHDKSIDLFESLGGNQNEIKYQLLTYTQKSFNHGDPGILLTGPPGTGKTHLVTAMLTYFIFERGMQCKFIEFFQLLSLIREQYDQNQSAASVLGPLVSIPILAIDELGKNRNSDWELGILDELISKRYNNNKSTFFTTNYPVVQKDLDTRGHFNNNLEESLEDRIGSRIFSRLVEMCIFMPISGPDYRDRKLNATQRNKLLEV